MIVNEIDKKISGMDKRKLLFIFGGHLSGKTEIIMEFLKNRYGDDYKKHYTDVGIYYQNKIKDGQISTYEIYPEEFFEDALGIFENLLQERLSEGSNHVYVLDHLEFLLSERVTEWLTILAKYIAKNYTIIVLVPNEYKSLLPISAYDFFQIG